MDRDSEKDKYIETERKARNRDKSISECSPWFISVNITVYIIHLIYHIPAVVPACSTTCDANALSKPF